MSARKVLALLTCNASLRDDYQGALRLGVERACAERDIDLWVFAGHNNWIRSADQHRLFRLLDDSRVDGIVLAAGLIESFTSVDGVLRTLEERCSVPMCAVGQCIDGTPSIVIDNARAAAQTAEHLMTVHGCQRFAYISGPQGHHESRERLRGVTIELARGGLSLDPALLRHGDFAVSGGRRAMLDLLASGVSFDALLTVNDHTALGAIEALREHGLACPEDVRIAGFDDAASARFGDVPLTTIRQPLRRIGALAVDAIARIWQGERVPPVTVLETELILRESCGCHPAALMLSSFFDSDSPGEELNLALTPVIDDAAQRAHWVTALTAAAHDESQGERGGLELAFSRLIGELGGSHVPLHELQRVISILWRQCEARGTPAVEGAFHACRIKVGALMYRRAGEQNLRDDQLVDELRLSGERLATSLERPALIQAILTELPRLGIFNGFIAIYCDHHAERLRPLLQLRDGQPCAIPEQDYPSRLLMPNSALGHPERISLTILPLTFESEQLGIAALELPLGSEAYALLREQIGSCIKAARIHEAMREEERLHAQAREQERVTTERLRSFNLIAGGVAHDMNNALGPLVALPETILASLEKSMTVPREVLEDLETIRAAGLRAAHTIQDLFLLGRADHVAKRRLDICRLLRSEIDTFRRLCDRKSIRLEVQTPSVPLVIRASGPHLVRVVSNLVLNAVDSIRSAGAIEVRAFEQTLEAGHNGMERVEAGCYAVIEIEDTGSGIPSDHLPRILEPFFTTKRSGERAGTGLGLAIVQRIVKDAGGFIDVRSQVEHGTTFTLYFPLEAENVVPVSSPQPLPVGGSERILIIDDETVQLRTAQRILSQLGYAVETARSGETAIELCAARGKERRFDLLIVDMVMPGGLDGLATIAEIRARHASQKVLIASGYAPDHLNEAARQRGLPWLAKPYTPASLAAAVRRTLDGAVQATTLDESG
jgi:phosphoserine phosphatase RsbU/P